ncbi:MAG: winged helix-turn-helix transcriptional regulator [Verrucomicrobia bacterium]|nr:MAG: winged helix-turn-helix transcriptional regulator [Verrucomicrobiota bacterium]
MGTGCISARVVAEPASTVKPSVPRIAKRRPPPYTPGALPTRPTGNHDLPVPAVDSPSRRRLPPLLRRAWYGLNQAFRRRIAHTGVTPDQFTAMRTLLEGDAAGLTQRDLTTLMSSDPNTVASLLERMEGAGWISRKPHESDRRAYRIRLLEPGRIQYEACRAIAVDLQSEVLAVLPETERGEFLAHLDLVSMACRRAADASPRSPR